MMFMAMRSIGRRHRDESTAEYVLKIGMNILINFSMVSYSIIRCA